MQLMLMICLSSMYVCEQVWMSRTEHIQFFQLLDVHRCDHWCNFRAERIFFYWSCRLFLCLYIVVSWFLCSGLHRFVFIVECFFRSFIIAVREHVSIKPLPQLQSVKLSFETLCMHVNKPRFYLEVETMYCDYIWSIIKRNYFHMKSMWASLVLLWSISHYCVLQHPAINPIQ